MIKILNNFWLSVGYLVA